MFELAYIAVFMISFREDKMSLFISSACEGTDPVHAA